MTTPESPSPTSHNFPEIVLPLGWNALVNHAKKEAIVCGEYKVTGKAFTRLELMTKPTKQELVDAIEAIGYKVVFPAPPAPKAPSA